MVQFYEFGDGAANRAVKKLKRFSLPAGKEPNMRYQTVIPGRFLSRPNRFVAQVETEEGVEVRRADRRGVNRPISLPA